MKVIRPGRLTQIAASLVALVPATFVLQSAGASPTHAELKLRRNWAAQHFDATAAALAFSFTYGGRPASELLPSWKLERERANPQAGRAKRTLTLADPVTGLSVRCDVIGYDDFPAVEWVLHFENRGVQDTPVL